MIKAIMFDLDNTLLPMDEELFTKTYFGLLCKNGVKLGFEPEELSKVVWGGTKAMIKNNGEKLNIDAFWEYFEDYYKVSREKSKEFFDNFYLSEFKQTKSVCGENDDAKVAVTLARKLGYKTILASNPLFPKAGMVTRMGFVGLEESDFDYITSYENSHYSKPNPKFYQEVLEKNNLKPEEVILFGNSENEDIIPAKSIGIRAVLVSENSEDGSIKREQISEYIKNAK